METRSISEIEEALMWIGAKSEVVKVSDIWTRLFVKNLVGTSIGRVSFKYGKIFSVKSYKRDYRRDIDETDRVFWSLDYYFRTGEILSLIDFLKLKYEAEQIVDADLKKRQEWREAHPSKRKRKRLEGGNPRAVLRDLIESHG